MKKILIVEDYRPLREEITDWLRFDGFEVYNAENGNDGVKQATLHIPDLILCDIMMPGIDGTEVLTILQEQESTQHIPFIFMTALATRDNVRSGMNLGADDYITKPFTRKDLLATIGTRLRKSDGLRDKADARITEQTEQLQTQNEYLEAFNYSISHDLRAPLRIISGFAGMLLSENAEQLDDNGKRMLGIISANAKKMGIMIDALLNFSKLRHQEISDDVLDMTAFAREVWEELKVPEIRFTLHPLPKARGDEILVRLVLQNLIGNSVKYSANKPIRKIEVGFDEDETGGAYFVRDNGAGFDMKEAGNLFTMFHRLHSDKEFEGHGIGLANVHRILERLNGTIRASAHRGEGATFWFTLPPA